MKKSLFVVLFGAPSGFTGGDALGFKVRSVKPLLYPR